MASHVSSELCPNCGEEADVCVDTRPITLVTIICNHCGLMINPKVEYMTLEELNEQREDCDMPLLKKLPKQRKDPIWYRLNGWKNINR